MSGKNASLDEMYPEFTVHGVPIPNGFALTTRASRDLLGHAELARETGSLLQIAVA